MNARSNGNLRLYLLMIPHCHLCVLFLQLDALRVGLMAATVSVYDGEQPPRSKSESDVYSTKRNKLQLTDCGEPFIHLMMEEHCPQLEASGDGSH